VPTRIRCFSPLDRTASASAYTVPWYSRTSKRRWLDHSAKRRYLFSDMLTLAQRITGSRVVTHFGTNAAH